MLGASEGRGKKVGEQMQQDVRLFRPSVGSHGWGGVVVIDFFDSFRSARGCYQYTVFSANLFVCIYAMNVIPPAAASVMIACMHAIPSEKIIISQSFSTLWPLIFAGIASLLFC